MASDIAIAAKLSPRDPLNVHFHGVVAMAWIASAKEGSLEKALVSLEAAAEEPNPFWVYTLLAAAVYVNLGDMNGARRFVELTLRQNADVSLKLAPKAIHIQVWADAWKLLSGAEEQLVEFGLPRSCLQ